MRTTGTVLDEAKADSRAALIGYLPTGFPTLERGVEAVRALVAGGADIVEVGMPYSDPGMDGEVIQRAGTVALAGGVRTRDVFTMVEAVAEAGATPVVMSYWNLVYHYGVDAFAASLASAGGVGLITPDLIPDEAGEWLEVSDARGLDRVFLVAPSSTPERLALVSEASRGFVYAASTMGVTGTRASIDSHAERLVADTRAAGAARVSVGVGVSTAAQAAEVAAYADGVIVGTALVRALEADGPAAVARLTEELAAGVRGAGTPA